MVGREGNPRTVRSRVESWLLLSTDALMQPLKTLPWKDEPKQPWDSSLDIGVLQQGGMVGSAGVP